MRLTRKVAFSALALLLSGSLLGGCGGGATTVDAGEDPADAHAADGSGSDGAVLSLDRGAHDFGAVATGSSSAATTFTVSNIGTQASGLVSVALAGADAGDFTITSDACNGTALAASTSCDISVAFSPAALGELGAELSISADPGGSPAASLSGTAVTPGALALAPHSHDFGSVGVGSSSEAVVFSISNTGAETSGVLGSTLTGTDSNEFSIVFDNCAGNTLAGGAACTLSVGFAPTTIGGKTASLTVSGSPGGTAVSALSGTGFTPATISISPNTHDFGAAVAGSDGAEQGFTVTNGGTQSTGPLSVSRSGSTANEFAIRSDTCNGQSLAGGASCTITIRFEPASGGSKNAFLDVTATPGGAASAELTGIGQNPALLTGSPGTYPFGNIEVGSMGTAMTWNITNTGDVATGPLAFSSSNATEFPANNTCSGSLGPGASCTVTVNFQPSAGGARNGTLDMSATPGGSAFLTVSGTGMYRLTVTASGTGTVTSSPSGVSCGGDCEELYAGGDLVNLTATITNGSDYFFSGWSGDNCSGPSRQCFLTMNGPKTVSATFSPMTNNLIFASSISVPSDLGGVAPYDAQCNALATAAGINNSAGNDFVAYISSSTSTAASRLGSARGWMRMDGLAFADSQSDMFVSNQIFNPVYYDEWGTGPRTAYVFTGTNEDGTVVSGKTCDDWTPGSTAGAHLGSPLGGPEYWCSGIGSSCTNDRPVLCMGTSRTAAVSPVLLSGKRIYLTNTVYTPGSMTPDQKCAAEKPSGVGAVHALIAYTTSPAEALLDPSADYVRVDGQLVGSGADIISLSPRSGIWQRANGTYVSTHAWTGQTNLTSLGTADTTCNDWSTTASTGRHASVAHGSSWFWSAGIKACSESGDQAASLYCVEQ